MKKKTPLADLEKISTKKLLEKAGIAVKNDFYLDASWILSAIFERKIKKVIEKLEHRPMRNGCSLEQAIKRLKYLHLSSKHPLLNAHFDLLLIDRIRSWKNQRNTILKDMMEVHVTRVRTERLVMDGIEVFKALNKAAKSFTEGNKKQEDI
ncbi:MAG: hypothetical protein WCI71_00565 [Bacteroidota bacterium]